jgi:hypothetical protein
MAARVRTGSNGRQAERWGAAAALLLFPLVMMQVGREWSGSVALVAGAVIGAVLLLVELVAGRSGGSAYRWAVTTALAASFLQTWINLVAGDPDITVGAFVLVLMAGVSAFAVRARADGLARAMLGIAAVQAILTALAATDPSAASDPKGIAGILLVGSYFTALWLVSSVLFHRSARAEEAT